MLPVVSAVARRRTAVMATRKVQQRGMGGHAPKPEWTGIDKTVRSYVPEDYQRTSFLQTTFQIPSLTATRKRCRTWTSRRSL
jgi:hypothetical protein